MDEAKRSITYPSNHPGVRIDHSHGQCACFLCKNTKVSVSQRSAIMKLLAQEVVRKDRESGKRWLLNWGLRHGQVALEVLERAIQKEGGR